MKAKNWIIMFLLLAFICMAMIAAVVIYVDPFFHYHKPVEKLYYPLTTDDERYVNHGICKNFDYDAIITGSSMSDSFACSQLNELFGVEAIKTPYLGATFVETSQLLETAFEYNDGIKLVLWGLDENRLFDDKDTLSYLSDLSPVHLYDKNPFNDVEYLFYSRAVSRSVEALTGYFAGAEGGVTDFDLYALRPNDLPPYPPTLALEGISGFAQPTGDLIFSDEDRVRLQENIRQNVLAPVIAHPETEFYYFFPPYSAVWWGQQYQSGNVNRYIEAERVAIETLLDSGCENLRLFSFNTCFDMITDMGNYRDIIHYGPWISRWMLQCMAHGEYMLTADNYKDCLRVEAEFYGSFDYNSLFDIEPAG